MVTPPLQLWHVFQTLTLVYQDAYFNQLNDRYKGKRDQFQQLAKWAMEKLIQTGLGIATDPIPQAVRTATDFHCGRSTGGDLLCERSWLNAEGQEGQAEQPEHAYGGGGKRAGSRSPSTQPTNAAAWNVYVGLSPTAMTLQNTSPLALDQVWVQAAPVSTLGQAPGTGQAPDYLRALPRLIQRG